MVAIDYELNSFYKKEVKDKLRERKERERVKEER